MRAYLRDLEKKQQVPIPATPKIASRYKWAVIAPDLLPGEEILCVMDEKYLEEAQKENPGLVTYLLSEMDALKSCKGDADVIAKIHMMKKTFGGWVGRPGVNSLNGL